MSNPLTLLERACRIRGLEAEGARLLRVGSNTVYRLTRPVVVRISRPGADMEHARRTVAVARWLESVNYPAVRVLRVDQPVVLDGHAITFWEAVSDDGDQYATVGEVAEVLVKLHELVAPDDLQLPTLERFEDAAKRIQTMQKALRIDAKVLNQRLARVPAAILIVKALEHLNRCAEARDVRHADMHAVRRRGGPTRWVDQPPQGGIVPSAWIDSAAHQLRRVGKIGLPEAGRVLRGIVGGIGVYQALVIERFPHRGHQAAAGRG